MGQWHESMGKKWGWLGWDKVKKNRRGKDFDGKVCFLKSGTLQEWCLRDFCKIYETDVDFLQFRAIH